MISVRSEVQILPGPPLSAKLKVVAASAVSKIPRERPGAERGSGHEHGAAARARGALSCAARLPRHRRRCRCRRPPPCEGRWNRPLHGGVAQLGERLLCKQEVIGSIPFTSTIAQQREAMVCLGSRDSDIPGMSRKRAVQERIRSLDALLKRSWKIPVCLQCACIAGSVL